MKKTASLTIKNLILSLRLGWTDNEQAVPQTVSLDIVIQFLAIPRACETDSLQDTICYDTLTQKIQAAFNHQPYRLIEHAAFAIHRFIEKELKAKAMCVVHLSKTPLIAGFNGQVCFTYGDNL